MINNTQIIFGNITFPNDKKGNAIIHWIEHVMNVPEKYAIEIAEELVNVYDSYLIPGFFDGTVTFEI